VTDTAVLEEPRVFQRIYEHSRRTQPRSKRNQSHSENYRVEAPNDHLTLVFDTETTTDVRQELKFGIARIYSDQRLVRSIVFTKEVSDTETRTISEWAKRNDAEVKTVERFMSEDFIPNAIQFRANVVGFNLPFDLARIAAEWEPKKRVAKKEAWNLWLLPRSDPKSAVTPRIRVERLDSVKGFIKLTGTAESRPPFQGAFVDLRTFVHVLTGEKHSLKTAGVTFGCRLKKTEQDYHGPVTTRYLDYCLNDVGLTWELYQKCLERYVAFGLEEHPSRLYSPASLAKAALKARGIVPPNLQPEVTGRIMAAFYGGKVECRVVGNEVPDVNVLDVTSEYPSLYCLLGAEKFLTAQSVESRESTEEVRAFLDSLTPDSLLRKETWSNPLMWSLCDTQADGDMLPLRSTYDGSATDAPTIGWNHVSSEGGVTLPYMLPDIIAAQLLGGKAPKIVRATTFEATGRQTLRPLTILGTVVEPNDDLIRALTEARIRERKDEKPGWEARALGLKIVANSGAYGIFVELNRNGKPGKATVYGSEEEPFDTEENDLEVPGRDFCPLLAATITSGAHLLLALVDSVVKEAGGEVVYCDTDSAFVTPSKIAVEVSRRFDSLNPFPDNDAFLKNQTEDKAPRSEYPLGSPATSPSFFGLSSKRYCLFVPGKGGCPHVFRGGKDKGASDHGLGTFEAPGDRKEFVAGVWESILSAGPAAADQYAGIPATARFSLSSPSLLPRVRKLGAIRPFTFLTARFLEPSSDASADRSELVPFVGPKDEIGRADLMDLPRQRSWSSVLEPFIRHRDRKCLLDSEGRMVRRHVLARHDRIFGLGKEANRIELGKTLGHAAAGSRAKRYVNVDDRVDRMGRAEAERLGLSWSKVTRLKRRVRAGLPIENGHGGRALEGLREAILSGEGAIEAIDAAP
jgi:hypothetical protein